jgi:hypothetical protein
LSRENDSLTGEQRHFQREDKKIITELKIKNKKSNPKLLVSFKRGLSSNEFVMPGTRSFETEVDAFDFYNTLLKRIGAPFYESFAYWIDKKFDNGQTFSLILSISSKKNHSINIEYATFDQNFQLSENNPVSQFMDSLVLATFADKEAAQKIRRELAQPITTVEYFVSQPDCFYEGEEKKIMPEDNMILAEKFRKNLIQDSTNVKNSLYLIENDVNGETLKSSSNFLTVGGTLPKNLIICADSNQIFLAEKKDGIKILQKFSASAKDYYTVYADDFNKDGFSDLIFMGYPSIHGNMLQSISLFKPSQNRFCFFYSCFSGYLPEQEKEYALQSLGGWWYIPNQSIVYKIVDGKYVETEKIVSQVLFNSPFLPHIHTVTMRFVKESERYILKETICESSDERTEKANSLRLNMLKKYFSKKFIEKQKVSE